MYLGWFPPAWIVAVGMLGASKILDNMEIGHNVMHGQYDWMREDTYNSREFEWDTVCPADQWKHSHNYMHHTYTNIVGEDRDVGYGILRMSRDQDWNPYYLGNLGYATALMVLFEWASCCTTWRLSGSSRRRAQVVRRRAWSPGMWRKAASRSGKDYIISLRRLARCSSRTLLGNVSANLIRNLWTFDHLLRPLHHRRADLHLEETENETAGGGTSARCSARPTSRRQPVPIMSGNLSHQIEHHLFPDVPANRYPEMSGRSARSASATACRTTPATCRTARLDLEEDRR